MVSGDHPAEVRKPYQMAYNNQMNGGRTAVQAVRTPGRPGPSVTPVDFPATLREDVKHIFDCFCEVAIPSTFEERLDSSQIRLRYPTSFTEMSILNEVPKFTYPCAIESPAVEHFSFVLLRDLKWLYGFCRCSPTDGAAMVLLSALPWHDLMYKLLDQLHLVAADGGDRQLLACLATAYQAAVPADGQTLNFTLPGGMVFSADCPDRRRLPSLLVERNLTEYWSVVDDNTKLEVFAALLHERHILVTSSRLGRLSACVQAAQALLYPLWWQRIFLPVVPAVHSGILQSPTAFLAGCPASVVARLDSSALADGCVRLDADLKRLTTTHGDLQKLPADVVTALRRQLRHAAPGDGVARAFQTAVLQLVGGYRHGISRPVDGPARFDGDAFLQSQPADRRPFLRTLLNTQMFQQFIEARLSRPEEDPVDALQLQPSVKMRRHWGLKQLMGGRRRLQSDGPSSRLVTAPLRASFYGPSGMTTLRRASCVPGLPLAATQSAPASPALLRLSCSGPSLPHINSGQMTAFTDSRDRSDGAARQDDLTSDDPLAGFSVSGGSSLMDEINDELQRLGQLSPLSDGPVSPLTSAQASSGRGGETDSDSDVFTGGATAVSPGGATRPPRDTYRPRCQPLTQLNRRRPGGGSARH